MRFETAQLQNFLKITEMMVRYAQSQQWIELWALQNERNKLMPNGIEGYESSGSYGEIEIINLVSSLENQIQLAVEEASDSMASITQIHRAMAGQHSR